MPPCFESWFSKPRERRRVQTESMLRSEFDNLQNYDKHKLGQDLMGLQVDNKH